MGEWKETFLREIATYTTGKLNSNAETVDGVYPFFTCSPETLKIDHYAFDTEALILAGNNANGIFSLKYYKGKFNAYQRTYIITIKEPHLTGYKFLFYSLKTQLYELEFLSHGTATKYLTLPILDQIPISLAPLPEQKAIASVLPSRDDKIDLLHRQNKTLEAMAETLFRQWFVEEVQEDWEERSLSSLADHKKINVRPDQNPTTIYHHYSIPSFDDGEYPIKELGDNIKSNKYQVVANSILISKLNPRFPRVWAITDLEDDNSISSTEFQVVLPLSPKYWSFIYCFLKSKPVTDELIAAAGGTSGSHQRVKPEDIFSLTFQMPNEEKMDEFDSITSAHWQRIANNKKQIRTLERLRDALLPKLMSGEVCVEYEN